MMCEKIMQTVKMGLSIIILYYAIFFMRFSIILYIMVQIYGMQIKF